MSKGWTSRLWVAVALTAAVVGHVWGGRLIPGLAMLEHALYDARVRASLLNTPSERVVIVDVDEASMQALGRWPWPRTRIAELVNILFENYGIRALGFDFLLSSAGAKSALEVLAELDQDPRFDSPELSAALEEKRVEWNHNALLVESLAGRNVVLGYVFKDFLAAGEPAATASLPEPALAQDALVEVDLRFVEAAGYIGVLDDFLQPGVRAGFVSNPSADSDGRIRRQPLLMEFEGQLYESFALAVVRAALGFAPLELVFAQQGSKLVRDSRHFEGLRLGERLLPLDERLTALIPFRGRMGSFHYYSFVEVIRGEVPIEALFDKIVLVGTTAAGLPDMHSTPVGSRFAGVEVHANMIEGMLEGTLKASPLYLRGVETLGLILVALFVTGASMLILPLGVMLLLGGGIGLYQLSMYAWQQGLDLPIANAMALGILLFSIQFLIGFAREARRRADLAKVFGQYIPSDVAKGLNRGAVRPTLEGQSREMTVLFTDVRGFTSIAEGLEPQELTRLMNEFLTPITRVIQQYRGTIDKYMGDAVMAFWGAPLADPKHAQNAVAAGLKMNRELAKLATVFKAKGWPVLQIGVGINTGTMHVGNMGSEFRVAYTVLGDAVNLGSRLEGLTKQYGVQLIVSESTMRAARGFIYRELDSVQVKGKEQPVKIFEPLGYANKLSAEETAGLQCWQRALQAYRSRDWETARTLLLELRSKDPQCQLYAIYLRRIKFFVAKPPPADWNGVFAFSTK